MSIKRMIRNWLDGKGVTLSSVEVASQPQHKEPTSGYFTLSVTPAINGKVLEIRTYKPQPRGSDWQIEYYIVPEGQALSEAVTMFLLMKGLNS